MNLQSFLILMLSLGTVSPVAAETAVGSNAGQPLVFGLLPSESAVAKIKRYAPLRDYLSGRLGVKIVLETARDFPEFTHRTRARRYDLVETAPHFVPPALDSGRYQVVTTIVQPLTAQIVVLQDSPLKHIGDLKRRVIATPSSGAIITRIGRDTLTGAGVAGTNAPTYKTYKTHNAAYEAVLGKQADAAIISVNIYNKARSKNEPLRSIGESMAIPNMSILVATDLPEGFRADLQGVLAGMKNNTEGQAVLDRMAYPGYRPARANEFNVLRPYLKK